MTRGVIRGAVRRRLNEVVARRWQDSDLNFLIDISILDIKAEIAKVAPEEFVETWRTPIVANQSDYPRLEANERALRLLMDGTYVRLDRVDSQQLEERVISAAENPIYCQFGAAYRIKPTPTANVTAGLEIEVLGIARSGITNDSTEPAFAIQLHPAIIYRTVMLAFDESGESGGAGQQRAEAEWLKSISGIPLYYRPETQGEVLFPRMRGTLVRSGL